VPFNPLSLLNPITAIGEVIDKFVHTGDEKAEARRSLAMIETQYQTSLLKAQKDVIVAEAHGNWLQRSWRPCLGFAFTSILVNNYIVAPYVEMWWPEVSLYLEPPPEFWSSLWYLVGGYMGLRTGEKVAGVISKAKSQPEA
jgi:hypothetical protein